MIRRAAIVLLVSGWLAIPCRAGKSADDLIDSGVREFRRAYQKWDGDGFAKAKSRFFDATKEAPGSADAHYWLGVARFHQMLCLERQANEKRAQSEREAAIKAFERVLEITPDHAESHALMATLLGMKIRDATFGGLRFGPALQRHRKAAMKSGAENPRVRYLVGVGLFHVAKDQKDYEAALRELQTAEKLYQKEAGNWLPLRTPQWGHDSCVTFSGLTLEKLGRNREAVSEFYRALTLHPHDQTARKGLQRLGAGQ